MTLTKFALVYPDRVHEVESVLSSNVVATLIVQSLDLLSVMEVPVPSVQLWTYQDDTWHPLYGASGQPPTRVLRPAADLHRKAADVESLRIASQVIRMYRLWQWQWKAVQREMQRRAPGEQTTSSLQLRAYAEGLGHRLQTIDEIVRDFCDPPLADVFALTMHKQFTPQKIADQLHFSVSTVHRRWRRTKMCIGHGFMTRLSSEEQRQFAAEAERATWSVTRLVQDHGSLR